LVLARYEAGAARGVRLEVVFGRLARLVDLDQQALLGELESEHCHEAMLSLLL
jgi:hypothetical protein